MTPEGDDVDSLMTVFSLRSGRSSAFSGRSKHDGIMFCGDMDLVHVRLVLDFEWGSSSGLLGLGLSGPFAAIGGLETLYYFVLRERRLI